MTRRIKRSKEFEVSLLVHDSDFIRPPREAQRNWMLNRAMKEFNDELIHLNRLAKRFVPGSDVDLDDRTQKALPDEDIMEDWQIPIMERMASIVGETHGDVLEIGFGRGIASTFVQQVGVKSHTIVECNDSFVQRYEAWLKEYRDREIHLLHGRWQDMADDFGTYDGILFHTYPLNEQDFIKQVVQSVTFAEHFFATAVAHLREGGVLTYLTNEIDSLSREHQRILFKYFESFSLTLANDLDVPDDTHDALWADSMVIIKVVK